MNPIAIETSLVTVLTALLPRVTVYPGIGYEVTEPMTLNVIAACPSVKHVSGDLWYAEAVIRLHGPALYGEEVFGSMSAALASVKSALTTGDWSGWGEGTYCGLWVHDVTSNAGADMWDVEIPVRLGLSM